MLLCICVLMDESKVTLEAIGALLDSKLDEKLQPLKFQVEDLSSTIESLKSSLQFISDKYDDVLIMVNLMHGFSVPKCGTLLIIQSNL